jgi:hypothetical protein
MAESHLFCSIRKEWVAALPEEIVRQRLLLHMIQEKGFPPSLITVEQSLKSMSHICLESHTRLPNRRIDIVCFTPHGSTLHPLLMVECKAVALVPSILNQIVGYNHFVRSSFIAIANQKGVRTGWYQPETKEYAFIDFLPFYSDLKTQSERFVK